MIDLRPHFPNLYWRPMPHSFGVPVASDWQDKSDDDPVFGIFKRCGLWTMDEADILYRAAVQLKGSWVDIGSNVGWTTAHVAEAGCDVLAIDPMYRKDEFAARTRMNLDKWLERCGGIRAFVAETSARALDEWGTFRYTGFVIDGDHDDPNPTTDAAMSVCHLEERGIILFHDARGEPVKKAIRWLLNYFPEFKHRVYPTPHGVCACWRGEFEPPDYVRIPGVPEFAI